MLELIPVIDDWQPEQDFEWLPSHFPPGRIELSAQVSDLAIARMIAILASYNNVACHGSIAEVARALLKAQTLVLPGGLLARTHIIEISPGCCCGLENWREWYGVTPNGTPPWLGHDPSPWVECKTDNAVLWADGDLGDQSPYVEVSYSEITHALRSAHIAMIGFADKLSKWISEDVPLGVALSQRFTEAFDVSELPQT